MNPPTTSWGHACDPTTLARLLPTIPRGYRLWQPSDTPLPSASSTSSQPSPSSDSDTFRKIIYSPTHNASPANLRDHTWHPPPNVHLDLWGVYLATKLAPSKTKRYVLWPAVFGVGGDLLRDFVRWGDVEREGEGPVVGFWRREGEGKEGKGKGKEREKEKWVLDEKVNGGKGMYLVWRNATVLASAEVQRELDRLNGGKTRTKVVDEAKRRAGEGEWTFGVVGLGSGKVLVEGDLLRGDVLPLECSRVREWGWREWRFVEGSEAAEQFWTRRVVSKEYVKKDPWLGWDTFVGREAEELVKRWAGGREVARRETGAPSRAGSTKAASLVEDDVKTTPKKRGSLSVKDESAMERPEKRRKAGSLSQQLIVSGTASDPEDDNEFWAVDTIDEEDEDPEEVMARAYKNGHWAVDWVSDDEEDQDDQRSRARSRALKEESDTSDFGSIAPPRRQPSKATASKTSKPRRAASSSMQRGHASNTPQRSSTQAWSSQGPSAPARRPLGRGNRDDRIKTLRAQIAQHKADASAHRARMQQSLHDAEDLQAELDSLENGDEGDGGEED